MLPYPVPFWRASGAGNDFLALVEPGGTPPAAVRGGESPGGDGGGALPSPGQVRAWCRRGTGAGADGVFVLRRGGTAVTPGPRGVPPTDPRAAGDRRHVGVLPVVTMTHFNADGSGAELCVNGTRCAALLAFELGWAADRVEVATGAGPVVARRTGEHRVALELPAPEPPVELPVELPSEGGEATTHAGWRVRVGVPHYVLVWLGEMGEAPVERLGRALRRHPAFGDAGTNVDFARFPTADRVELRTFERGVEGETLACGSGVLAAVAVGRRAGALELPVRVATAGGGEMTVAAGGGGRWSLEADARLLARGEILPGAEVELPRPGWLAAP